MCEFAAGPRHPLRRRADVVVPLARRVPAPTAPRWPRRTAAGRGDGRRVPACVVARGAEHRLRLDGVDVGRVRHPRAAGAPVGRAGRRPVQPRAGLTGTTRDEGRLATAYSPQPFTEDVYQRLLGEAYGDQAARVGARYPSSAFGSPGLAWWCGPDRRRVGVCAAQRRQARGPVGACVRLRVRRPPGPDRVLRRSPTTCRPARTTRRRSRTCSTSRASCRTSRRPSSDWPTT